MTDFHLLDNRQLLQIRDRLQVDYHEFKSKGLSLDLTRGKPSPEQLDLSLGMLDCVNSKTYRSENGTDCRNYGGLDGIPEAKRLFANYLQVEPGEIIISGNSSLNMMHDTLMRAMVKGAAEKGSPWVKLPSVKFLCPSPGYDRHFFICEYLGIEMIPVPIYADGPDMDMVEKLVAEDQSIKGIWCVPRYSNPTGAVYSDTVVDRLAAMKTRAPEFRIFWDNAYAVHHFNARPVPLKNILTACKEAGNADRVLTFGSTSKLAFAGSGISMMAGSEKNVTWTRKQIGYQTIGPDKLNQLRHVIFFKDIGGIENHMQKHASILKPKFDAVQRELEKELAGKNIASWSQPTGGYFVSIDTMEGCAKTVVQMSTDAGVKLTPAGSTFPYMHDPMDRNIRIAPSFPPLQDVVSAMQLVTVCIQLSSIEKLLTRIP